MSDEADGGYVHDPSRFDADGERATDEDDRGTRGEGDDRIRDPARPDGPEREFGRRGWVLVGVIVVAFVASPLAIVLWPPDYNYLLALLILPLVPAFLLGVTAVWATTRP